MAIIAFSASAADKTWVDAAECAQSALKQHYWNATTHVFRNRADRDDEAGKGFNYWWQAYAVTCVAQAVQRGSRVWAKADLAALREGILARNGGHWTNDYYDDESWMACAMLDAAAATGEAAYRVVARKLWDDIHIAWNDNYGDGIPWRKTQLDYKNAPANGPAIFIGAVLFQADRKADDLAQSQRIYEWLVKTLRDPQSGLIWDGINRTGKGTVDKAWRFTYNQGIFIGACLELHRATHEARYLADAERTGTAALDAFFAANNGLCHEGGNGDGGLFKGILVRHLATLAVASPQLAPRIRSALEANGQRLAQLQGEHPDALLPTTWDAGPAPADLELSAHLSGTILMEALIHREAR
ncbi:MAG TPA: glycoside hydrolase family 76 protein [Planctomycetota bacterium]|nr:glycoside hydrolase family 76 protein [Planctomycetota bacterium]